MIAKGRHKKKLQKERKGHHGGGWRTDTVSKGKFHEHSKKLRHLQMSKKAYTFADISKYLHIGMSKKLTHS